MKSVRVISNNLSLKSLVKNKKAKTHMLMSENIPISLNPPTNLPPPYNKFLLLTTVKLLVQSHKTYKTSNDQTTTPII